MKFWDGFIVTLGAGSALALMRLIGPMVVYFLSRLKWARYAMLLDDSKDRRNQVPFNTSFTTAFIAGWCELMAFVRWGRNFDLERICGGWNWSEMKPTNVNQYTFKHKSPKEG